MSSSHMARFATEKAVFRPALPSCLLPGMTEMQMASKNAYFEKLKDPRWQRKRLERLEKSHWACDMCCDSESTLHVHHNAYFKGREPWEYDVDQLSTLCESCHADTHEAEDPLLLVASYVEASGSGPYDRDTVASLIAGFCSFKDMGPDPDAYFLGRLADAIPKPWMQSAKPLDIHQLQQLIVKIEQDPIAFSDALRAFAGIASNP